MANLRTLQNDFRVKQTKILANTWSDALTNPKIEDVNWAWGD